MVQTQRLYDEDLAQTRENRARLGQNVNLMYWYGELYRELFANVPDLANKRVLEVGSGASPLKQFVPSVITTDILALDHLDIVFDCHDIANLTTIPERSLDIITMTNVLHHLRDPIRFLQDAARKLAPGGQIILVEPYFSFISFPLYKLLHYEPTDFSISRPVLEKIDGPLSTSNQAMPHMIFFSRPDWLRELNGQYETEHTRYGYFTSIAYMATGGISRVIPVPHQLYRAYFVLDRMLARRFPKVFAAFFSVGLTVRG